VDDCCGNGTCDEGIRETCSNCSEDCGVCPPECGNNVKEGTEECDGTDDSACPGLCQEDCTCWTCGDTLVDSRDGQEYATVLIGNQCWMAENINVGMRIDGTNEMLDNGTIEKYCYNNDDESYCTLYGGLYQWGEAMQYANSCNGTGEPPNDACSAPVQGICPTGWHIPSHYEWTTLEREVCDSDTCATDFPYDEDTTGIRGEDEGTQLKTGGSSGFKGLLTGFRTPGGSLGYLNQYTDFWSSLGSDSDAWRRGLASGWNGVVRDKHSKLYGFSVRCVKD